jgi:ABC-2 type transport system ATP-binding protein
MTTDLVILDEPTGGLDPLGRMEIREIIAELRGRGKTVFFSSHELSEVELVCDRVAILVGGGWWSRGPRQIGRRG